MNKFIKYAGLCCAALFYGLCLFAQSNITAAEYFIDTDPGFGNATGISIPSPTMKE